MGIDITFKSNLPELMKKIDSTAKGRMLEAVIEVRNKTLEKLTQPGTGRTYTHYFFTDAQGRLRRGRKRWKPHTASAEGKPPAIDTGELRQSIKGTVEVEGREVVGRIGTNLDYGKMLEFGTRRMKARPWLKKSFEESEAKVKEIYMRLWF